MGERTEFAGSLAAELLGAAGALLVATRTWQSVRILRPRPLADQFLAVSGRTLNAAPTALALVALAGVVAVVASRGLVRRAVGLVVAASGVALVAYSLLGSGAISVARAQSLARAKHSAQVALGWQVHTHPAWPVLSAVSGGLVVVAGVAVLLRGHRWGGLSARYDAPSAAASQTRGDAALWNALDRGDDPTASGSPSATRPVD
jgi:uncharacterized membrane protein (TIGR02234 family)